ncbi:MULTISPECIES: hypothetical protein [Lacticaseibacillus]|uniref:Uncharacterized protein n=1 Tax=Lacticaseibacillus casei DSM 20011 = JCM 1134 = ATCC 393 TaxID=1423732 RepID=A0AAD1ERI9_LACCA|nr:hypothetical protein [Lacticaseibacillus casei]MBI6598313.1 hypothetical protein [Lacticaseibacillus casei]MBO1481937.1 hypothetical protein [Lacticaseibacillus casei]MBO2417236.1 hypothetical protein [Lacticaseibacillus casei]MCK2081605.1 hypothetical protein [Lacticaseibacillus casei]MDZ5496538.1 hypothetical protein [Lacticaseibacillus casei]
MTKKNWYRVALVAIAIVLIAVIYGFMQQHQIANPFLVGGLGLTLGVVLALLLASFWQPHNSQKH